MKGPSHPLELRVLRVFTCGACGRKVYVPGAVTSHLCSCGDPPRFMVPEDRPATRSPDVTRFISPADPSDLIEEPEIDLGPHVPFVPRLPPRPAQFASRRKLSDDIDKFVPAEFGDGVEPSTVSQESGTQTDAADPPRPERQDQRARRDDGRSGQNDRQRSERGQRGERSEQRRNSGETRPNQRADERRGDHGKRSPDQAPRGESGPPAENPAEGDAESKNRSRRNRRRRGRNERDDGPIDSTLDNQSDATFGDGIEATASKPQGSPSKTDTHEQRAAENSQNLALQQQDSGDDFDDDANSENENEVTGEGNEGGSEGGGSRRRRNRRRGRRRGRGPENSGGGQSQ